MPVPTIIFDDGRGQLSPLTDLRAAFDIRTGAFTNVERVRHDASCTLAALVCPAALEAITRERHGKEGEGGGCPVNPASLSDEYYLVINGRMAAYRPEEFSLGPEDVLIDHESGDVLAACVKPERLAAVVAHTFRGPGSIERTHPAERLLQRPWDVRRFRDAAVAHDVSLRSGDLRDVQEAGPPGVAVLGQFGAFMHASSRIAPTVVLDTELGIVAIDEHAVIRPGAIVCGPAYIGPHSTVLDRCLIKPNTSIGPHCKVAGEIGGTIFQGFANKAHDGHLGDSYVGEWVNLGAGTTNSNLLNTYGEIIVRLFSAYGEAGPNERTGEQFLGAIIGDHCKFAICTRIMTGAIVGTGTMWAASAPVSGTIAPFSWVTDSGTRKYAMSKFAEVMKTVMARRKTIPGQAYMDRVAEVHERTPGAV